MQLHQAGFDLREIEDVIDQFGKIAGTFGNTAGNAPLLVAQVHFQQQIAHAEDAIHRRADFVGHAGQETALGLVGLVGGLFGLAEFRLQLFIGRDVARNAHQPVKTPIRGTQGQLSG